MIETIRLLVLPGGTFLAGSVIGLIVGMLNWYHPSSVLLKHIGYAIYISIITFTAAPNYLDPAVALGIGVVSIIGVAELVEWYADELLPLSTPTSFP